MITLPNECYCMIFNNLRSNYNSLLSCSLVNRHWCRIVIPILWNDPKNHFKDIRLIKVFLLTLNDEERTLLIPFKLTFPNHPKPLFEYTSYITCVNKDLYSGIRIWLRSNGYKTEYELVETAIQCSLIAMSCELVRILNI
ncbi:f-box domain-containing protein [Gigaspora margarita]|uniref:F-box domain-containing protein n=1 Tax=Gigaspora margarita TaxID=4874 RepID=A0A8H3XBU0_GIGMA|nr:f-box domain-containing protein [Gigaspora margarita]